ncbi:MAG: hypothetical protein IKC37_04590 [Clostridia bacterium]|nr:hypothetical protein [Clostridia bacterium]
MKSQEEKLNEVLMKVAKGCRIEEIVEEYAEVDGQMRLVKRKETRKDIPPDIKAVQMLQGSSSEEKVLSDEQLEEERLRLLQALQAAQSEPKDKKKGGKYATKKVDGDGGKAGKGQASCGQEKGAGD